MCPKRKKRAKRGRPRINGCVREPNGRILRAKKPYAPADQLVIQMRMKHFGLRYEDAKSPLAGSYIGRLCLSGGKEGISQEQYDAAQQYLQVRNDYLCAKGLPSGHYDNIVTSQDQDGLEKWVTIATNRYEDMKEAIKEVQCLHPSHNFYAALQYLVIENQSLPYLVNSLRIVLNALHKHFCGK
ncbi:hypothetical protein [Bartonella sp. A05]|uniref:hypothetical protein n=1 Tax=Bartonella sp. A05 TaxID=2967261 RepID=UPI0022A8E8C0|nr:hypothetical protein [Bartonella sp. A05]MCZ2204423.1 hypothetical protein [Bartonella sp. A05]